MIDCLIELLSKLPFESRVVQTLLRFLRRLQRTVGGDPYVDLYGCPCSERTAKLQLEKRIVK